MMFLYSIFCQWFSRGCLISSCLEQTNWQMLLMVFMIGYGIGSPVQGYMSDKGSRKKILLFTISGVILSVFILVIGGLVGQNEYFPILLSVASIVNGVFGNVFPAAAAAYSERIDNFQDALKLSLLCRYGALALPFLLKFPHFYSFLIALILNLVSFIVIAFKFKDKDLQNTELF